jgi:hypothetical protein
MPNKKESKKKVLIKIPIEDEGLLSDYGYSLKNSHEDRVKSIKKSRLCITVSNSDRLLK